MPCLRSPTAGQGPGPGPVPVLQWSSAVITSTSRHPSTSIRIGNGLLGAAPCTTRPPQPVEVQVSRTHLQGLRVLQVKSPTTTTTSSTYTGLHQYIYKPARPTAFLYPTELAAGANCHCSTAPGGFNVFWRGTWSKLYIDMAHPCTGAPRPPIILLRPSINSCRFVCACGWVGGWISPSSDVDEAPDWACLGG